MLENSSKPADKPGKLGPRVKRALGSGGAVLWALGSVFGIGAIGGMFLYQLIVSVFGPDVGKDTAMGQLVGNLLVYVIGFTVMIIEPLVIRSMALAQVRDLIGIARRIKVHDVLAAIIAWAGYLIMSIVLTVLAAVILPQINLDQSQDIGFGRIVSDWDIVYIFLAIVIAAPIMEELIFRGYLYGTLRRLMPWWAGAVVTGVVFGLVHGQWNVALDTFALSMIACYLREYTGSIWAGVVLHALKNSIAFLILFVAPHWLQGLLGGV